MVHYQVWKVEDMRMKVIVIVLMLSALVYPVAGAINTIEPGNTVFIGEDNLDVTAALASYEKLAHFSGGDDPDRIITVTSPTAFYISPSDFSDRSGAWYAWSDTATKASAPVAFYVDDPYLTVKVRDIDLDIDVSDKWIPRGDNAGFTLQTNLGVMTERGIAGAPITIKVKSPSGTTYATLADAAGNAQSLDVEVPSSPYDPGISWYTGDSRYSSGSYTVYLECNANNMNDNYYKEGTTISKKVTVLVQSKNPLITSPTETTTTTIATTTLATPVPTTVSPTTTATTSLPATTPVPATVPVTTMTTATVMATATATPTATAPGFGMAVSLLAVLAAGAFLISRR